MSLKYLVNEIYPCLQGEGPSLGMPSVLVRFQICNLRCTWCDTPYTHTARSDLNSQGVSQSRQLSVEMIVDEIHSVAPHLRHIIFTGGEPTLQNLVPILEACGHGYSAEVETNGTQIPHEKFPGFSKEDYAKFQWNVSPKGNNAGEKIVHAAMKHWSHLASVQSNVYFKWVVRSAQLADDTNEILALQNEFSIPAPRIILMPEGTTIQSQIHQRQLHDVCLQHGFRYSPRLHILIFDNQRGV